jgi:hypothetical protein
MSDVVVVIGYILLFPSLIGMAVTLALTGYVIIVSIVLGAAAKDPQAFAAGSVFAVFTVAFGAAVFVSCFVSGLIGWLLVMKKTVLRCNLCGMTIDAA